MKDKTEAGHETVAKFIDATMKERGVSDKVAAKRMGYNSATIIRMFRDGRAKVSFDEVPDLAAVAAAGAASYAAFIVGIRSTAGANKVRILAR
jgi:hypothetical protein